MKKNYTIKAPVATTAYWEGLYDIKRGKRILRKDTDSVGTV